jgi:citrate synthase
MGGFVDNNPSVSREKAAEILTKLWVLYADHEMTNSTAAFLHVSSTLTDPLSSLVACSVSAYGLLHGGAIDAAYRGMREIGGVENVPKLIERVVNKLSTIWIWPSYLQESGPSSRIYSRNAKRIDAGS